MPHPSPRPHLESQFAVAGLVAAIISLSSCTTSLGPHVTSSASTSALPGQGQAIEVFVVGDSWAAFAGNSASPSEDQLPDGLGSVYAGHDVLRPALTQAATPSGNRRFTIAGYHS